MELLELENKTIKVIKISEWKTNKTNIISMVCEALKAYICEALKAHICEALKACICECPMQMLSVIFYVYQETLLLLVYWYLS